jgi:hypothetical protein
MGHSVAQRRIVVETQINRRETLPTCPRCRIAMVPVAHVESFRGQPALDAYECPQCKHAVSRLRPVGDVKSRG